jgi:hypothetical protein
MPDFTLLQAIRLLLSVIGPLLVMLLIAYPILAAGQHVLEFNSKPKEGNSAASVPLPMINIAPVYGPAPHNSLVPPPPPYMVP